jgi:4'-phosphopantetheinyl transferase
MSEWCVPEGEPSLGLEEAHVWRLSLALPDRVQRMEQLLDEEERIRAGRFRFEKDRRRYTLTRGMLRTLLGRYLRCDPIALRISYSTRGKPFVDAPQNSPDVRFNVSHAGDLALLAFCREREIGVDVESRQRLKDWQPIAERIFSRSEKRELSSLPPSLRTAAFYNGWTRKEAYLKATGEGLVDGLSEIEVAVSPLAPASLRAIHGDTEPASKWWLCALEPAEDYAAALVIQEKKARVRLWRADGA